MLGKLSHSKLQKPRPLQLPSNLNYSTILWNLYFSGFPPSQDSCPQFFEKHAVISSKPVIVSRDHTVKSNCLCCAFFQNTEVTALPSSAHFLFANQVEGHSQSTLLLGVLQTWDTKHYELLTNCDFP